MKVIISGATGYIGAEILKHALSHPLITTVVLLTRRAPDPTLINSNPKAKVIILKDFTSYDDDDDTLAEIRGAQAAIWCLGTYHGDHEVDVRFPLAFIEAVKKTNQTTPFRYVQLGGALTEPPPPAGQTERSLWFMPQGRRIRGLAEASVLSQAEVRDGNASFNVVVVKPAAVVAYRYGVLATTLRFVLGDSLSVGLEQLGAAMVDLAVNGDERSVLGNREVVERGRTVLNERKTC